MMAKAANAQKSAQEGRARALDLALAQVRKTYGEGVIRRYGEQPEVPAGDAISSGSISVDRALGCWGFPRGRVIEVFGPESSGKTTLALQAVANAQASGGVAAFIDVEHALDPKYTRALGVNLDELLISQPDYGEQALDIVETLVKSNAVDLVVVDSVAALLPRAELDGDIGDSHVGLQARLMSQALRKLSGAIKQSNAVVIFTNQLREKVGVMFGSPETTSGGRALKFYASVRLDIRRIQSIKQGGDTVGNRTRVRVTKNKVAAPFKEAEFDIMFYENGISKTGEIIDLGTDLGIVDKRGAFYRYGETLLGQGRENAKVFLHENPPISDDIEDQVRGYYGLPTLKQVKQELDS